MAYINRHIEQRITELSKTWSAILLTGPRQSGKTTMLKNLAEKENIGREYISLDDLTVREMAKNDPKMFLQLHKPPMIIDEVQYAPELFTYIKIHVDTYHNPGDFWLTGSQIFSLMKGVQESLAGRVALLHMSPLSQREIVGAQPRPFTTDFEALARDSKIIKPLTTPEMYERIWNGCMPGMLSGAYTDRNMYYSSYLSTYIERDVRELSGAIDALKFAKFITAVAARASQLVNYKAIADDADIVNLHNWSQGSFSGMTWDHVKVMLVVVSITFIMVLLLAKPLSAYQLGEVNAQNAGVNVRALRVLIVLLSSILSACIVAFAGPISFVGIAVPHLMKKLFHTQTPLIMIPACFLGGSVFCLFSDLLARMLLAPTELSISTVTAIFGAPVVLWIMIQRRKERG